MAGRPLAVASEQALDRAIEGMDEAMPETFEQLDEFLVARGADVERI